MTESPVPEQPAGWAPKPRAMRAASYFTGIGGADLGLLQAGIAVDYQCEIDQHCQRLLARHFPDVERDTDVRTATGRPVDFVAGGFSCQDLSVAGKRAGLAGERSGLWFEFRRLLAESRPRWVVVENVPGLLSSHGGRDFAVLLRGLVELGYGVTWRVLDAQYFGVAQRRRRVFIVGSLGDGRSAEVLLEPESVFRDSPPRRETGEGLAGTLGGGAGSRGWAPDTDRMTFVPAVAAIASYDGSLGAVKTVSPTLQATGGLDERGVRNPIVAYGLRAANTNSNGWGVQEDVAHTLDGATPHAVAHPLRANRWGGSDSHGDQGNVVAGGLLGMGVRRLTPTECERLQGFPDGWTEGFSDSTRYRMLGSAICVPVMRWIAERIVRMA